MVVGILLFYLIIVQKRKKQFTGPSTKSSRDMATHNSRDEITDSSKDITTTSSTEQLLIPMSLTLAFHLLYGRIPMILVSVIGMTALAQTLSILWCSIPFHIGIFGLLCSTFRTIPTLNKCFGYPLRLLVTVISEKLLNMAGIDAAREGTGLIRAPCEVFVDGPCSGITMLWTGLFLTFALSLIYSLSQRRIIFAVVGATLALIGGNIFRVIGLFVIECKILETTILTHNIVGTGAYCLAIGGIFFMIKKLAAKEPAGKSTNRATTHTRPVICLAAAISCLTATILIILSMTSFNLTYIYRDSTKSEVGSSKSHLDSAKSDVGWPTSLYEETLTPAELSPFERASFKHFPGSVARFETEKYRVIIFFIEEVTRELHSRALCLEAAGFKVHLKEGFTDRNGCRWSSMTAEKTVNGRPLSVPFLESTFDSRGKSFSDLSEWYWSVFLGNTTGPWWHYSLEEKLR
jgi:exosortase/archaeosortase family protein